MNRLKNALMLDVRLQLRNGFYWAVAAVVILMALVLRWVPEDTLRWIMPVVLLGNFLINGLLFLAGLVMLERAEGSLEAQVVTPLRRGEYLASKSLSLCLLSLIESLAILLLVGGPGFSTVPLVLGIMMATALLGLFGFVLASRYRSITEFLFPSVAWMTVLMLPLLGYFGIGQGWWLYLHPMQAPMVLLKAAFYPVAAAEIAYGVGYSLAWVAIMFAVSLRAFERFVVYQART